MSKHKKKPTQHQNEKLAAARYRNEFLGKMKFIIDSCCGKEIYPLIPQENINSVYKCRCNSFVFIADNNCKVPVTIEARAKILLAHVLKTHKFTIQPNNVEINLADYFTVVVTIFILQSQITIKVFKQADKVKEALNPLCFGEDTYIRANDFLISLLRTFSFFESDLSKCLVWYNHDLIVPNAYPERPKNNITIYTFTPESISVKINGSNRPAIRVGCVLDNNGPHWLSIKPADLNIKGPFAGLPVDVYIQSHALIRLKERIDCFEPGFVQFNLFHSLVTPTFCYDINNNLLIEYSFFSNRIGYLRVDMVNGILLIRTFFLITNNSTPEGQLLEKNTGLLKNDHKYFALDKMSTFMTSEIGGDLELSKILKSSGCQSLVDACKNMSHWLVKKDQKYNVTSVLNYIHANENCRFQSHADTLSEIDIAL